MAYTIETVRTRWGFVAIIRDQSGRIVTQTVEVAKEGHAHRGARAICLNLKKAVA